MYSLHRLRLLREFELRGTVAAVAEALNYTPSAVSQQLSQLEREAGMRLLEPVGRGLTLTRQGEILAEHAAAILTQVEVAEAELIKSISSITGTLRVAAFQTALLQLIPEVLNSLRDSHAELKVLVSEIDPDGALMKLTSQEFDMIIGEEYPGLPLSRSPEVVRTDLLLDPMQLAYPTTRSGMDARLADFAADAWVMEPLGNAARSWATRLCREAGFEPDVRYESNDLMIHHQLVLHGHACALLPGLLWGADEPQVRLLNLPRRPHRTIFTAVRRGSVGRPDLVAFHEALTRSHQRLRP